MARSYQLDIRLDGASAVAQQLNAIARSMRGLNSVRPASSGSGVGVGVSPIHVPGVNIPTQRQPVSVAPPSFSLASSAMSSGVSLSARAGGMGGMSQFIGRLAPIMSRLGPVAIVIGAAAIAIAVLTNKVKDAAAAMSALKDAATVSGGNTGNISFLTQLGIPAGQISGMAASLRGGIVGGGFPRLAASQLGIGPILPRELGGPNEAEILERVVKGLASIDNAERRLITARRLGVEGILGEVESYRRYKDQLEAGAEINRRIMDPETLQLGKDLTFQFGQLTKNLGLLGQTLSKPFLKGFVSFIETAAKFVGGLALMFDNLFKGIDTAIGGIVKGLGGTWNSAYSGGANPILDPLIDPLKAIAWNTAPLRTGTIGGGPRAAGALPAAVKGYLLDNATQGNAMRLGAYALF